MCMCRAIVGGCLGVGGEGGERGVEGGLAAHHVLAQEFLRPNERREGRVGRG